MRSDIILAISNLRNLLAGVIIALVFTCNLLPILAQEKEVEKKTEETAIAKTESEERFTLYLGHLLARGGRTCRCLRAPTGRPSKTVDEVEGRKKGSGEGE